MLCVGWCRTAVGWWRAAAADDRADWLATQAVEKYGFRVIGLLQEMYRRVVKLGEHHTDTADIQYNIGICYQQHGDNDMALRVFYRALRTYKMNLGPEDFKTCGSRALLPHTELAC